LFSNVVHEVIAPVTYITESKNKSIMDVNRLLDSLGEASDLYVYVSVIVDEFVRHSTGFIILRMHIWFFVVIHRRRYSQSK